MIRQQLTAQCYQKMYKCLRKCGQSPLFMSCIIFNVLTFYPLFPRIKNLLSKTVYRFLCLHYECLFIILEKLKIKS